MNIAPISNIKLTFSGNTQAATQHIALNSKYINPQAGQTQGDSWNFSINKKKAAKIATITTLLAVGVLGAIYAKRRGRAPKEAKGLIEEANKFAASFREKLQSTIDETAALYKNGGKDANGNIVAKITEDVERPATKIMESLTQEGNPPLIRSVFVDDNLRFIEKLRDDGKFDTMTMKENGQISRYEEGILQLDSRHFRIEKSAFFKNNKPYLYTEDNCINGYINTVRKQVSISESGKPTGYMEDYTSDSFGTYTAKTWTALMGKGLNKRWHNMAEGIHKA